MGRFRIQLFLEDITLCTRFNIPKNDRYSDSPTQWNLVGLTFNIKNHGIKLIYDETDTAVEDMCFRNISITHSVYQMDHVKCFEDIFESKSVYIKTTFLMFLVQNNIDLQTDCGFLFKNFDCL